MKKALITLSLGSLLLTACGQNTPPSAVLPQQLSAQSLQSSSEILVRFKGQIQAQDMQAFQSHYRLRTTGVVQALGVYRMKTSGNVRQVLSALQKDPRVLHVEMNGLVVGPEPQMQVKPIF